MSGVESAALQHVFNNENSAKKLSRKGSAENRRKFYEKVIAPLNRQITARVSSAITTAGFAMLAVDLVAAALAAPGTAVIMPGLAMLGAAVSTGLAVTFAVETAVKGDFFPAEVDWGLALGGLGTALVQRVTKGSLGMAGSTVAANDAVTAADYPISRWDRFKLWVRQYSRPKYSGNR